MAFNLKTVAVYNTPIQAQIACNQLKAAGLWAMVTDAEIVSMDLLLSSAVGGVKVQVKFEDADKAADILMDVYGDAGGVVSGENIDEEELARQAMAEAKEEIDDDETNEIVTPPHVEQVMHADSMSVVPPVSEREAYARRFFFATLFSLLFLPLIFYSIYLLLNSLFGKGSISWMGVVRIVIGMILLPTILALYSIYVQYHVYF